MLKQYKKQVLEAEGRRLQAASKLENANERWAYHKQHFFNNPANLLLPFTAGALLASRGSATRQMINWSRVVLTSGKLLLAAYPLFRKVKKAAVVAADIESHDEKTSHQTT